MNQYKLQYKKGSLLVEGNLLDELKAIIKLEDENSEESNNPWKSVIQTMSNCLN